MKAYSFLLSLFALVFLFEVGTVSADLLCVQKNLKVPKNGKIALSKSIKSVTTASCPGGFVPLYDATPSACITHENQCSVSSGYLSNCSVDCGDGNYLALHGVRSSFNGGLQALDTELSVPTSGGKFRKVTYAGVPRGVSAVDFWVQVVCCTE